MSIATMTMNRTSATQANPIRTRRAVKVPVMPPKNSTDANVPHTRAFSHTR